MSTYIRKETGYPQHKTSHNSSVDDNLQPYHSEEDLSDQKPPSHKKRITTENASPNTTKDTFDEDDSFTQNTQPIHKVSKIDHSESPYMVFKISVSHMLHFFRIIHVPSSINLHYFFNIVLDALDWNNETHRIHPHYYIDTHGKYYGNTKSILQMPSYESSENATHRHFPHIEEEHDFSLENVLSEENNRELELFYTYGKEWKVKIELQSDKQTKLVEEMNSAVENRLVYCIAGQGGYIDESNMKVEGEFNIDEVNKRLKSFE